MSTPAHGIHELECGREEQAEVVRGIVKFSKADKGWGALVTPELPRDVWVHFSVIEGEGFRELEAGDEVDFDVEAAVQDSFRTALHERGSSRTGLPRPFAASATTSSSRPGLTGDATDSEGIWPST